jgi:hypothetical protein
MCLKLDAIHARCGLSGSLESRFVSVSLNGVWMDAGVPRLFEMSFNRRILLSNILVNLGVGHQTNQLFFFGVEALTSQVWIASAMVE